MNELIAAAKELAIRRWGNAGWAGAAAMRLSDASIISSVFVNTPNEAANLCHETGAICEAHKRNATVVATACVSRECSSDDFVILSPCGICQERLAFWGPNVEVAVAKEGSPTSFEVRTCLNYSPIIGLVLTRTDNNSLAPRHS